MFIDVLQVLSCFQVKEMFRVPVLQQQFQRLTQAMDKTDEEDRAALQNGVATAVQATCFRRRYMRYCR